MSVAHAAATDDSLPEWNLSDLYVSTNDPDLERDFDQARSLTDQIVDTCRGKMSQLGASGLVVALQNLEKVYDLLGRIGSFAHLHYATDMSDPERGRFLQTMEERSNKISGDLIFFSLELNRIDDDLLNAMLLESSELARYTTWIDSIRADKPYQLSDDMERLLHDKSVCGHQAWVRLFDETCAALRFDVDGSHMGMQETLHLLSSANRAQRKSAADALSKVFEQNSRLFTHITNTLAKDKEVEDQRRNYPDIATARHLSNQVEAPVVDALVFAVRDAYPELSHRYYAFKANWLGLETLEYWDRNAPVPGDDDRIFTWQEAVETVIDAYGTFAPWLADIGQKFFDNPWVDAAIRPGKPAGAFAHSSVPSHHPYLLVNYLGKSRDVMTLAHELGHGVHQMLARDQGPLLADTPLTLAETASVFGEQLTFRALLSRESDPERRRALLASKIEDMLNTVVRQTAFYQFERTVHTERRNGELSAIDLGRIWMDIQKDSLGPAFHFADEYKHFWCYVPHFIHSPFYVYAYAFGDCLVNALYAVYEEQPSGFADKYHTMLAAGGSLKHQDLLAPFGLNASDPAFWQRGLGVIRNFIDDLERTTY